ncbi:MAG: hypothetical protein ACKO85_07805 [Isosphaeraceae bacterium]
MHLHIPRRRLLQASAVWSLGSGLGPRAMAITPFDTRAMEVKPEAVRLRPEIEPVVRWIEETPREKIIEVAIGHLKAGLAYRELMAGLFLAGIRNIKPRPVGFKFHAVMVIHSAHLLGQAAAVDERLLPMLWALDTFKASQATDVKEGDWALGPVDETRLPKAWQAKSAFHEAMEKWDAEAADAAIVAFGRAHGAADVMESFWKYAIRDQRNIGHKAIFAAQCWRTLQAIGWQNAEPVLRSLAFALLDRQGAAGMDVVGPYVENLEVVRQFPEHWPDGTGGKGNSAESLIEGLRKAAPKDAGAAMAEFVKSGSSPQAIWDVILKGSNELLLRKPGIVSLHAVTSINALHYIFTAAGDDTTRKLAMAQAAGWVTLFRQALGDAPALDINQLEPLDLPKAPDEVIADIFATVGKNRTDAARKTLGFLQNGGSHEAIFAAARRMIFHKGRDSHDYKFGAAAWEESLLAGTPRNRELLTAAMMGNLPASTSADSPLMIKAREAAHSLPA